MPSKIVTRPWTLFGWLWGIVGIYVAMLYLMGWYLLFATPLMLLFFTLRVLISYFSTSFEDSLVIAIIVMSPFSIWFVIWQLFYFVGPAYIDILRSVGLFLQRAHSLTPTSALAMMRQRRTRSSQQMLSLVSWLLSPLRGDKP